MILAPLRGVTIRCFRETFASIVVESGFTEALTPFIPAMPGLDPLKDRELKGDAQRAFRVTPQFIGKDPATLRDCLRRIREAGYEMADLNAGCPYPMVRNKGRGSGLLKTPDVLRQMLEVGCEELGEGRFSLKTRLGLERPDELLALMPLINAFPLRFLTVHARTARQMYEGVCDREALLRVRAAARVPIVENGDLDLSVCRSAEPTDEPRFMIGRSFIRSLGDRPDTDDLLRRYVAASCEELDGDRPVLGRIKELLSYWKDLPRWRRKWPILKICRSVDELQASI